MTAPRMHPTARRCVAWAVGLFVGGSFLSLYGTQMYLALADLAGPGAVFGVSVVEFVMTLIRWTALPTGAALVGAAVVIQALTADARAAQARASEQTATPIPPAPLSGHEPTGR